MIKWLPLEILIGTLFDIVSKILSNFVDCEIRTKTINGLNKSIQTKRTEQCRIVFDD